jgi:signal peptidase II
MSFLSADSDGERWALVALTTVIAAGVAVWMWREKLRGDVLALSLVLGGALGNIVDRVRYGYVVDYADLHIGAFRPFYIFNLADACISMGVLILLARAFLISDKQTGDGADVQQPESSADIVEKS